MNDSSITIKYNHDFILLKNELNTVPLKKLGKPKDIGQMILFLCSDEASYITGQTFYIDGGMSLN